MIKGVDISRYNAGYKIEKGIDFIIVKGSEGRSATTESVAQIKMARASGLVVGFYHWLHKGNIKAQAKFFVDHVKPRVGELLVCDWEDNEPGGNPNASAAEKDEFIAECKRLAPGVKVGLYLNPSWDASRNNGKYGDFLWIANYVSDSKPRTDADWLLWQYTETPRDYNRAKFSSRAEMLAWAKGDDKPAEQPKYQPPALKERVSWRKTPGGNPVRACTCMIENIEKVVEPRLKAAGIIKYSVDIFQGAYSGSSKSAGTHTGGGAVDVAQYSDAAVKIWRTSGWDFWRRGRDYQFDPHGHGILRGCPHLSNAAEDQHDDYKRGRNALYDNAKDPHDAIGQPLITWREAIEKYAPDKPQETQNPPAAGGGGGVPPKETEGIEELLMTATWKRYSTDKPQKAPANNAWTYLKITKQDNVSLTAGPARVVGEVGVHIQLAPGHSAYFRAVEDDIDAKGKGIRRVTYRNEQEVTGTSGRTYVTFPLMLIAGGPKKGYRDNLVRIQWHSTDPNATITYAEVGRYSTGR